MGEYAYMYQHDLNCCSKYQIPKCDSHLWETWTNYVTVFTLQLKTKQMLSSVSCSLTNNEILLLFLTFQTLLKFPEFPDFPGFLEEREPCFKCGEVVSLLIKFCDKFSFRVRWRMKKYSLCYLDSNNRLQQRIFYNRCVNKSAFNLVPHTFTPWISWLIKPK